MGTDKFCLRWNDFESNISSAFRELRDDKDFFDVTLACDDDQIKAHKVIIAACSPFFRNILRRNHHQHPLLYLKGVKLTDLQSILNFIYHGEVNVAQEELNSFLAVAEDLKIKGLTQNPSTSTQKVSKNVPAISPVTEPSEPKIPNKFLTLKHRPPANALGESTNFPSENSFDDIQEVVPVKPEPLDTVSQVTQQVSRQEVHLYPSEPQTQALTPADDQNLIYTESYDDYSAFEDGQDHYQTLDSNKVGDVQDMLTRISSDEGKVFWRCEYCGKEFPFKSGGKRHIETMHYMNTEYECEVCGKLLKNKNSYQNHISITHGIKRRKTINPTFST